MAKFKDRTGDFTNKTYLYKFYKNGYTSKRPKYITNGQYLEASGRLLEGGYVNSGVMIGSTIDAAGSLSIDAQGAGGNAFATGPYMVETDSRRKMDLKNIDISFGHGGSVGFFGELSDYTALLFDYTVKIDLNNNNIIFAYKGDTIATDTYSEDYRYLRLHESGGVLYIENSEDRQSWTEWSQHTIDFESDILKSTLALMMNFSMAGPTTVNSALFDIEAIDKNNQLLAIETDVNGDLEFNETINTPASATTIELPYNPLALPEHCDIGNFVEIYANFFDTGALKQEPILDENEEPILDENEEPIYGVVIHGNLPEKASIQKFSGYISSIDYDYDNEKVVLSVVSHGESMANSVVIGDDLISVSVLKQAQENASVASGSSRQTFKVKKMTKVDIVELIVQYSGGGSSTLTIGTGNQVIASSNTFVWSGGLGKFALPYRFENSVYLQAGVVYWLKLEGMPINWYYQNSNVFADGSRQSFNGFSWDNVTGDVAFEIFSTQPELNVSLAGGSVTIANEIYRQSIARDYTPLYIDEVQLADYAININLNIDNAKNAFQALYRQLPTGWFYHIDVGTGAIRIKDRNATPDHLLVFGRDFTGMKVTKDIDDIINEVYYIGGDIVEGQKLTVRSYDVESVAEYRKGLSIISNDKVTRYDTAQLLSQNTISNNNAPRLTTEITLSAMKYNIESVRIGDVVKIANGDRDVLGAALVVAAIAYSPNEITVSLDSAPRNISRTIDAIQRDLENQSTANASAVL